jgi:hypothetical protein
MFGPDQPVILQLLEVPVEKVMAALKGVAMELEDCAFPLLQDIITTSDPKVGFKDANWSLLVGAKPRGPGMERADLLKELSSRVSTELPSSMVDREIDRRLEEFVGRLFQQGVDPMKAGIDWKQFRDEQKGPAEDTVRAALLLDEIAKREKITVTDEDVRTAIEEYAAQSGREPASVRATLEKEGGLGRIYAGLRRERTVKWLLEKANIS